MTTNELKIEGMSCAHCSAAVTRALESVKGVVQARVDLAAGKATVEGTATIDQLVAAVVDEGYRAAPLGS
ncbi:MAG TPA: heavy metal-associated domain-containing protein [Trueperaceae bacterium]|nr:heavy metal-associated domain-containing protein [Trueperaceae bacterium]